jgi:hypothetical protein
VLNIIKCFWAPEAAMPCNWEFALHMTFCVQDAGLAVVLAGMVWFLLITNQDKSL